MQKMLFLLLLIPALAPGQTTIEFRLHSNELKSDRTIRINTPAYYDLGKDSLQLIFLLDGDNTSLFDYTVAAKRFTEGNAADLSDYKTPEAIIIGIGQSADRWDDFGDSVNSRKFLSFLEKELMPFVESHYRTVPYKVLIGHSLAGRFAINTLLTRPELFNAIIAASPAIPDKLINKILSGFDNLFKSKLPFDKALYFSTTYMKGDGTEEGFRPFAEALVKYLKTKNVANFRYEFNSSATLGHAKSPFFSIPEGIHFIYSPSLWQLETDSLFSSGSTALSAVNRYLLRIKKRFGITVPAHPFAAILADEWERSGNPKEAIELLKTEAGKQPADIDLFVRLLALLKKNNLPEYKAYQEKLATIFQLLQIPEKEQKEWKEWIDNNSH
ncbi:MAG: alpha/beta hydrolase-fold protein [Chitinophagaceae bacterium]